MVPGKDHAFHRYLAYHNYLDGLARLIRQMYPANTDLVETLAGLAEFHRFKRRTPVDLGELAMVWRHGWYTELLMCRTGAAPDLFPFAVPWSMVHAYYAINRAMMAYFMVSWDAVPRNHTATLRSMSSELRSPSNPFPQPWRAVMAGDPAHKTFTLTNAAMAGPVKLTNPLEAHSDPWQNYGLLLRTTRQRVLDELVAEWKRRSRRQRIRHGERQHIVEKMLPTTFFDALYRIRRRANYQDSDSFIFSRVPPEATLDLHRTLCDVVDATLMVFECLVDKVTPEGWLDEVVDEFAAASNDAAHTTVGQRRAVARSILG